MKSLGLLVMLVVLAFVLGATGVPGLVLETAAAWLLDGQSPASSLLQGPGEPEPA